MVVLDSVCQYVLVYLSMYHYVMSIILYQNDNVEVTGVVR